MTAISCSDGQNPVPGGMDGEPWQQRARRAGLTQKKLAALLGVHENTVSKQLREQWATGIPKYVKFAILMWEKSSQDVKNQMLEWAEHGEDE
ncbi:helix-turn-helix domain-containing protein [Xanthobacter versatilis]|uniref:helix-turn-helix domain-containing protein n=1 Tax=Xanthobacter autotrophicus (strain ATCC BAA-1158 / Py2) TaxID=78245 RepID=UPI00372BDBA7